MVIMAGSGSAGYARPASGVAAGPGPALDGHVAAQQAGHTQARPPCNWRAISQGACRSVTVTDGYPKWLVKPSDRTYRTASQADSASSILVTCSTKNHLLISMITIPLAGHQDASCRPRARYVPDGLSAACSSASTIWLMTEAMRRSRSAVRFW